MLKKKGYLTKFKRGDEKRYYVTPVEKEVYFKDFSANASLLFDNLLKADKKGIFKTDAVPLIGYPTGFPVFDYSNGYRVRVPETKEHPAYNWDNVGIFNGTFVLGIGNSGTGKTTAFVQMASEIAEPFKNADIFHVDGEHSSNTQHVMDVNGWTPDMMEDRYHMLECDYVEDLYDIIVKISKEKLSNPAYKYDTGKHDEFGKPITGIIPTIFIVDSIPTLQTKDTQDKNGEVSDQMEGQTYNMRLAIAYNTFYKRLRPVIYRSNIIIFAINHIKEKPELAFQKTQAKIQYLKTNESVPGGTGPIYLSQTFLRFIYRGKCTIEKHGFDGYKVDVQTIKSKTNRSDRIIPLIFDYTMGFDKESSLVEYAAETAGVISGRNPYCYLTSHPDIKFNTKKIHKALEEHPELYDWLLEDCRPALGALLSSSPINLQKDMGMDKLNDLLSESFETTDVDKEQLAS